MKSIYDDWIDKHIGSWSAYQTAYGRFGTMVMNIFNNKVYSEVWMVLVVVTFLTCFLFYFYFNKRFGNYYSLKNYFIFWFINIALVAFFTGLFAFLAVNGIPAKIGSPISWLVLINTLYAFAGFLGFSLCCQGFAIICRKLLAIDFSPMGNRTPF